MYTTQKMKFSIKDSSVNVTKLSGNCGFGHFVEEILNGKLHFLCNGMCNKSKMSEMFRFLSLINNHISNHIITDY